MKYVACQGCDLVLALPESPESASVRCTRCGSVLVRRRPDTVDRTLAWTVAAAVVFAAAIAFPLLGMQIGAVEHHAAVITGVVVLYNEGMVALAALVSLTCVVVPTLEIVSLLYVLLPLRLGRPARYAASVFRMFHLVRPWGMVSVFVLGILVALVKLHDMATILPGLALYAFAVLVFVWTFALSSLDPHHVWEQLDRSTDG